MAERRFEVVEESEPEAQETPLAVSGVMLALKALSQRALIAAASLFTLITVFGAWWLWWLTPDPNANQIISLSIYALFVLAANWIIRRRA
jgi:hypothetical protein